MVDYHSMMFFKSRLVELLVINSGESHGSRGWDAVIAYGVAARWFSAATNNSLIG